LEILVKNIIAGRKAESSVVADPESLALYKKYYSIEEAAAHEDGIMSSIIPVDGRELGFSSARCETWGCSSCELSTRGLEYYLFHQF